MTDTIDALHRVLARIPNEFPGPGGAVAVLRRGEVIARQTWGWADVEKRIPFTPATLFRVCSITKQFTCGTMLSAFPDPSTLDGDVAAKFPLLAQAAPRAADLANNQSGLRDYWATAMVCGATVERPFGEAEAARLIGLTRSLHFQPGTRYSYCNQNFRILGDVVASRTGQDLDTLMRRHIFAPAGMATARLVPDTETMPDGTIGYEGSVETGFRAAVNRINWTGDAGLAASLDDMIAWEKHIDATRDDPDSLYGRLSVPVSFADGGEAGYGFGLARFQICGRAATGHGGGLRGWTSFRCNIASERVSVVVLFNHMSDTRGVTQKLVEALLDHPASPQPSQPATPWQGVYEEPGSGLVVRLETTADHHVKLYYSGRRPEILDPVDDTASGGTTKLRRSGDELWMDRGTDNQSSRLLPSSGEILRDFAGVFHNDEYDARITCIANGEVLYGAFSGFLGEGMMHPLLPAGPDLWRMPMPRALDDAPPGDWTLKILRNDTGTVTAIQAGCWLARCIVFSREA